MSETIVRRRAAWQALKMGPLWQPLASALPGACWPADHDEDMPTDTPAPAMQPHVQQAPATHAQAQETREAPAAHAAHAPAEALSPSREAHHGATARPPLAERADEGFAADWGDDSPPPWLDADPDGHAGMDDTVAAENGGSDTTEPRTPAGERPADDAMLRAATGRQDEVQPLSHVQRWQMLREEVAGCQRCPLAKTRQNTVFGRGQPEQARWLLIGEAPGAEEDRQGEAFVGQAGKLLDAMLRAAGIDPGADVFIANVLKCRPPGNRNPEPAEVAECEGFLHEQIRLTNPDCILLLGRFSAQSVLNSDLAISRLRNKVHRITLDGRDIPVIVTFHPAYLLRNPADKLKSWEDLCLAQTVFSPAAGGTQTH
ncbi:MAG: uracil-DNA glycosylase [Lautropia sp.]|nr:uracil-DNA glycosylase [Lautropia sp.]